MGRYIWKSCNKCVETFELDSAHFLSTPRIAWQAYLKKTEIKLELLNHVYMLQMAEKANRKYINNKKLWLNNKRQTINIWKAIIETYKILEAKSKSCFIIKKVHRITKFNQKAWFETLYWYEYDFENDVFKVMKNSVFWKTIENVWWEFYKSL